MALLRYEENASKERRIDVEGFTSIHWRLCKEEKRELPDCLPAVRRKEAALAM